MSKQKLNAMHFYSEIFWTIKMQHDIYIPNDPIYMTIKAIK